MSKTTFRTVRDQHGRPLPAAQPLAVGGWTRNAAVSSTPWVIDATAAESGCLQVLTYQPIRFASGAGAAAASAALAEADGTGADRGRPAGFWLIALPEGHTHVAVVACSQATAAADVTVEIAA